MSSSETVQLCWDMSHAGTFDLVPRAKQTLPVITQNWTPDFHICRDACPGNLTWDVPLQMGEPQVPLWAKLCLALGCWSGNLTKHFVILWNVPGTKAVFYIQTLDFPICRDAAWGILLSAHLQMGESQAEAPGHSITWSWMGISGTCRVPLKL